MSLEYFKGKNIWFIWSFAFLVRIVLCFFDYNIFSEEVGLLYQFQNLTQNPISFTTGLIIKLTTGNPIFLYISIIPGYVNLFNFSPPTAFVFPGILSPFFALGGILAVRIFLAFISSLSIISFNLFIKELTRNEELITISTILYGFNLIGIYFASHSSIVNVFYTLIPLILFLFLKQINSTRSKNYLLDPVKEPQKIFNIYVIFLGLLVVTFNFGLIIPIMYLFGVILLFIYSDSRKQFIKELIFIIIFAVIPGVPFLIYGASIDHILAGFLNESSITIYKSFSISAFLYYFVALGVATLLYLPFVLLGTIYFYDKNKLNKLFFLWLFVLLILCIGVGDSDSNLALAVYSIPFLLYFTIQYYEEKEGEFWIINKNNYPYLYIIISFLVALVYLLISKVIIL